MIINVDGLEVHVHRSDDDGVLVVQIDGPSDVDVRSDGTPRLRVWINEALIFDCGETGADLTDKAV